MGGYHSGLTAFINMITVIVLVTGGILITKSTGQRNRFSYIFTLYQYYDRSGPHDDRLCGDVPERIFRL